jgi:hypothetical protein
MIPFFIITLLIKEKWINMIRKKPSKKIAKILKNTISQALIPSIKKDGRRSSRTPDHPDDNGSGPID